MYYSPYFTDRETEAQRITQSHSLGSNRAYSDPRSCSYSLYSVASASLQCLEKLKTDSSYDPAIPFAALCSTETCSCVQGDKHKNVYCNWLNSVAKNQDWSKCLFRCEWINKTEWPYNEIL